MSDRMSVSRRMSAYMLDRMSKLYAGYNVGICFT